MERACVSAPTGQGMKRGLDRSLAGEAGERSFQRQRRVFGTCAWVPDAWARVSFAMPYYSRLHTTLKFRQACQTNDSQTGFGLRRHAGVADAVIGFRGLYDGDARDVAMLARHQIASAQPHAEAATPAGFPASIDRSPVQWPPDDGAWWFQHGNTNQVRVPLSIVIPAPLHCCAGRTARHFDCRSACAPQGQQPYCGSAACYAPGGCTRVLVQITSRRAQGSHACGPPSGGGRGALQDGHLELQRRGATSHSSPRTPVTAVRAPHIPVAEWRHFGAHC